MDSTHDFDTFLKNLPIFSRRDEIVASVNANQVTIITAETGAGKSTQVPQYLAEDGYKKIIVTQPRILAARNLCSRVRDEYSWRLGTDATEIVGYRTAHERDDNSKNVIMYCTDGLQLVRELTGSGVHEKQVLVLDEIHEWNENMEVLIAWAKKRCSEDPGFKVVLMSATIEANELATYFDTVPPISVDGRSFPVTKTHGTDLINEILQALNQQKSNILVFLPGKAEIEDISEVLKTKSPHGIPIIPLHSQLAPELQQLAFGSYPDGKVVLSTNIAQTSVTIDDIDVVIDSGLERRSEVRNGIEGLFLAEVSQADCLQRAGRAGRTKSGRYVLAQLGNLPCKRLEDRDLYGIPEIMRKHIDRLVLRLANIGIDIEELDFYHSPSKKTIKQAKQTLASLGAIDNAGNVTATGRKMERFPVESSYARMLVESGNYPQSIQRKLALVIAIQEVGGIIKGGSRYTSWRRLTRQTRSDLLAQYDVYLDLPELGAEELEEMGIITKNVLKAKEVDERLVHDLLLVDFPLEPIRDNQIDDLLKCIVAGQLHQLWVVGDHGQAIHLGTGKKREISSSTIVKRADLVSGVPFDLEVPTGGGLEILHLVNDITAVDPKWLAELAGESFELKKGRLYFDSEYGALAATTRISYRGQAFEVGRVPVLEHTRFNEEQFVALYAQWAYEKLKKDLDVLKTVNGRIPKVTLKQVQQKVGEISRGATSLMELSKVERIALSKLAKLELYMDPARIAALRIPERHTDRPMHRRGKWRPAHKRRGSHRR